MVNDVSGRSADFQYKQEMYWFKIMPLTILTVPCHNPKKLKQILTLTTFKSVSSTKFSTI